MLPNKQFPFCEFARNKLLRQLLLDDVSAIVGKVVAQCSLYSFSSGDLAKYDANLAN